MGLIEAYGTGIAKIFGSYVGHTVKPLVELSDHVFKVTLPNRNFVPAQLAPVLTDRQQKVLDLAPVTRKQVQEALNVSQSTANSLLRNLVDLGLLTQAGAGRNTVYEKTVNFANNNHYYY